jgi:hypothetical protein
MIRTLETSRGIFSRYPRSSTSPGLDGALQEAFAIAAHSHIVGLRRITPSRCPRPVLLEAAKKTPTASSPHRVVERGSFSKYSFVKLALNRAAQTFFVCSSAAT